VATETPEGGGGAGAKRHGAARTVRRFAAIFTDALRLDGEAGIAEATARPKTARIRGANAGTALPSLRARSETTRASDPLGAIARLLDYAGVREWPRWERCAQ
jgi:hypothetical protein